MFIRSYIGQKPELQNFGPRRRPMLPLLENLGDIERSTSTNSPRKVFTSLLEVSCFFLFLPIHITIKLKRTAVVGVRVTWLALMEYPILMMVFALFSLALGISGIYTIIGSSSLSLWRWALFSNNGVPPRRQSKLHFLLPAHNSGYDLCGCMRTHLLNGFDPLLVNFGHDAGGDKQNKYYKIAGVYKFLNNATANDLQPGDTVAVVDGFDVWSQLPAHILHDRFVASGKRILLGVDKQCYPSDPRGPVCNNIPESPLPSDIFGDKTDKDGLRGPRDNTRPRWVNSGLVVGYFEDMKHLYDSMIDFNHPDDDKTDDQRVFAIHYYWGNFSLDLDFYSQITTSVAFSLRELEFMANDYVAQAGIEPWEVLPIEQDFETSLISPEIHFPRAPVVRYTISDTVPVLLHFPGVAKRSMNAWHKKMWWTVESENRSAILSEYVMDKKVKIVESGEIVSFRELCGEYMEHFTFSGRNGYTATQKGIHS